LRVLFAVFPSAAHFHPMVPLAQALQSAGHEVYVAIHPDLTSIVTSTGLSAVPIGRKEDLLGVVELSRHPERLEGLTANLALDPTVIGDWDEKWRHVVNVLSLYPAVLDDLVAFARNWKPDLVVWDTFCVPAAIAARVCGAAHVRFLWGQDNVAWLREKTLAQSNPPGQDVKPDPLAHLMEPMLQRFGYEFSEEMLVGQWTLDPMPPRMRLPAAVRYIPIRRVPYNGAGRLPEWLHERPNRPRVCLTLGIGGRGRQFSRETGVSLQDLFDSVATMDIELVATLEDDQRAQLRNIPDNVRVTDYVPLDLLLPTCSAVVHHGGGGTFATAVAHRVPQIITPLPFWGEQAIARFVEEQGAGLTIDSEHFSAKALCEQLLRVLNEPSFQRGADALYREMLATPGPNDLVPVLERMAAQRFEGISPVLRA
jgi:glycosyltransferase (activator-dependent family)